MGLRETGLRLNKVERQVTGINLILRRELEGTPFSIGPILLCPRFSTSANVLDTFISFQQSKERRGLTRISHQLTQKATMTNNHHLHIILSIMRHENHPLPSPTIDNHTLKLLQRLLNLDSPLSLRSTSILMQPLPTSIQQLCVHNARVYLLEVLAEFEERGAGVALCLAEFAEVFVEDALDAAGVDGGEADEGCVDGAAEGRAEDVFDL